MGRKQYGGRAGGAQGGGDGEIYARACGPRKHGPGGSVHWSSMNGGGPSTYVAPDPKETHAYKAERDGAFKAAVARAEKAPHHKLSAKRQYSKWLRKKGRAWEHRHAPEATTES